MYRFDYTKDEQRELIDNCGFTKKEKEIFMDINKYGSRKYITDLHKDISTRTISRKIRNISEKIQRYKEKNMLYGVKYVYIHIFPNGKKYIGVCENCHDRWRNGQGYAYNKEMYDDIQKYGWENIEHKILISLSDINQAYNLESELIKLLETYKSEKGYNTKYRLL